MYNNKSSTQMYKPKILTFHFEVLFKNQNFQETIIVVFIL